MKSKTIVDTYHDHLVVEIAPPGAHGDSPHLDLTVVVFNPELDNCFSTVCLDRNGVKRLRKACRRFLAETADV